MLELVVKHGCGLTLPSCDEIKEKYLRKEAASITELLEEHKAEWRKTGCSIVLDEWTDKKRGSICNFLVNSRKGTIFLSSIDTSYISNPTDKVFEMLDEIIGKVGEENVVQVITKSDANYKAAGKKLMEKRKRLFWMPCAVHCINLILEDFHDKLKAHHETIAKGRRITRYIYTNTVRISMLRRFAEGRDLIKHGETDFVTAYLTLGHLNYHKGSLMAMFHSSSWESSTFASTRNGEQIRQLVFSCRFWQNVTHCLRAAYPLVKLLRLMDLIERPSMPYVYQEMKRTKDQIRENFKGVKKSYEPIWKIVDERWEFPLYQPLVAVAFYLNPEYHYNPDLEFDIVEVKLGLYTCMRRLVPDVKEQRKIDLQIRAFKAASGTDREKHARDKKIPAYRWDSYGDECPELQKFAVRILSLTCSSMKCDRNWSAFGLIRCKLKCI